MSCFFSPLRIPHGQIRVIRGSDQAKDYLRFQVRHGKTYRRFVRLIEKLGKTGQFLEIGCGPGLQTALIANAHPGATITVVEPSADMLNVARQHLEEQGVAQRVRFVEGYVEDGPLLESLGSFDLVYSSFSLHHWDDPDRAFRNVFQVLKPGGSAVIYDMERHWLTYHLPFRAGGVSESVRASYTRQELVAILEQLAMADWHVERRFPFLIVRLAKQGNTATLGRPQGSDAGRRGRQAG